MMRVVLLAASAAVLFVAFANVGTGDDPYAPNDWLFSHIRLAQIALAEESIPLNRVLLAENGFGETRAAFQEETGIARMTFYANAMWHFWNGLPLHPAFLASLSALTGLEPETASRVPVAGIVILLLVYASADLLLRDRAAHLTPFVCAIASAPLLLDMRTVMPSSSLVVVALVLHLLLRRQLEGDKWALAYSVLPLALLPFWYYTVSYFVILIFVGFALATLLMRLLRVQNAPVVPLVFALIVPIVLTTALAVNGALTSHLNMTSNLGAAPFLGSEAGSDYETHLNRETWRSGLLYAQLALLFLPLAVISILAAWSALRRRPIDHGSALFAQWALGALLFCVAMQLTVGVSFLNRGAVYLTPLAAIAIAWAVGRSGVARQAAVGALAVALVATPLLVATAAPTYDKGDAAAFTWMEERVPQDAVIYGSLDASSVLFREHGFHEALAFHPRTALLDDFWYSTNTTGLIPYLASVEWFVLRDDARTVGFEEFGPLREPISEEAYAKFGVTPDLHRMFDNGAVEVFAVGLARTGIRGT